MNKYFKILKNISYPNLKCIRRNTQCKQSLAYTRFLRNVPQTQCSVLSNGITVATEERQSCNVCMGIYMDAGSRNENESENGIMHFFEHIAFKGTNKRSKTDLKNEISRTGAEFKCFTNRDFTAYFVQCLSSEVTRVADILFDCLFNNSYSSNEIEIQKNTIYQEMLEHDKTTSSILYDYLHSTAFQGTKLGQTVMGPSYNLYNFKSSSISNYFQKIFSSQKIVFASSGGVGHELMTKLAEDHFKRTIYKKCIAPDPKRYTGSQVVYRDDSMNLAHVAIAVEAPSFQDKDKIILQLASSILGSWDSSQPGGKNHGVNLAQIASSGNFCESYKTFCFNYQDVGLWGVDFISQRQEVDDMLLAIQNEWMRLCYLITDNELIRAKNEMKFKYLKLCQTTVGACHDIGLNVLRTNYRYDIHEMIDIIDNITAADLRNVCNEHIYDRCPVVVGIGSTETLLPYSRIRSYMYWLRI